MRWHDVEQNSPEWDDLKLGKASSSGNAIFMAHYGSPFGEPAKKYALKLALERTTGRKAGHSFKNDAMERGHAEEPIARMLYEEQYFMDVTNGGFYDCGEHGDSPDGNVGDDGLIEIKSVEAHIHKATIQRGAPDPAYKWQLAGHLDCSGRDWVDYISFCSDYPEWQQIVVYRVHRADVAEDLAKLAERRAMFLELVQQEFNQLQQKAA